MIDAQVDLAAVGFELGFAGAPGADATAELGHRFAASCEAWELVFELREFDLELAFAGAGMAGEDVEDELRAVDDAAGEFCFKVAQLRRGEIVVEEDEVRIGGGDDAFDLFELTASDKCCRIGSWTALNQGCGNLGTGGAGELFELAERCVEVQVGRSARL